MMAESCRSASRIETAEADVRCDSGRRPKVTPSGPSALSLSRSASTQEADVAQATTNSARYGTLATGPPAVSCGGLRLLPSHERQVAHGWVVRRGRLCR